MVKIGIREKRWVLRIAALLSALYAIEPTRAMFGTWLNYQIGPVSIITIAGALTVVFIWGHYKRWW